MNVTVIGANHRTMPMALRERLAIGRDRLPKLLADLQSRFAPEAVVLSTCNRVEIYLAGLSDELLPDKSALAVWFAEYLTAGGSPASGASGITPAELQTYLYQHQQR